MLVVVDYIDIGEENLYLKRERERGGKGREGWEREGEKKEE